MAKLPRPRHHPRHQDGGPGRPDVGDAKMLLTTTTCTPRRRRPRSWNWPGPARSAGGGPVTNGADGAAPVLRLRVGLQRVALVRHRVGAGCVADDVLHAGDVGRPAKLGRIPRRSTAWSHHAAGAPAGSFRAEPTDAAFVLSESCLRRVFGGNAVMHEQMTHLANLAQRPNIRLQVLPFDAPGGASTFGFTMLRVPAPTSAPPVGHDLRREPAPRRLPRRRWRSQRLLQAVGRPHRERPGSGRIRGGSSWVSPRASPDRAEVVPRHDAGLLGCPVPRLRATPRTPAPAWKWRWSRGSRPSATPKNRTGGHVAVPAWSFAAFLPFAGGLAHREGDVADLVLRAGRVECRRSSQPSRGASWDRETVLLDPPGDGVVGRQDLQGHRPAPWSSRTYALAVPPARPVPPPCSAAPRHRSARTPRRVRSLSSFTSPW